MGQCVGIGIGSRAILYTGDSIGCIHILRKLCAYGIPMGLVGGAEYRYAAGGMGDYVGTIGNRVAD